MGFTGYGRLKPFSLMFRLVKSTLPGVLVSKKVSIKEMEAAKNEFKAGKAKSVDEEEAKELLS